MRWKWWLLVLCGIFEAVYSLTNLVMETPDGSLVLRTFATKSTAAFLGYFAVAAGACAVAAGIWGIRRAESWLLVLNGLALSAFGLICIFGTGRRLAFRWFALLIVVMAVSAGAFELAAALRRGRRLLGVAGAGSVGFAAAFLALAFHWIWPQQPESLFIWMSAYFAFSAIGMLGLAFEWNRGFSPE